MKSFCLGIVLLLSALGAAQSMASPEAALAQLGKLYQATDAHAPLESFALTGLMFYQAGIVSGTDATGSKFSDSQHEFRRVWLGANARFLQGFRFASNVSFTQGKDFATGANPISFRHVRTLTLTYDLTRRQPNLAGFSLLELGYGRRTLKLADEWQTGATALEVVERSAFANKISPADSDGSNPVGLWGHAKRGADDFEIGVFSTTFDDVLPGWSDGLFYYAQWKRKLGSSRGGISREFLLSGYIQERDDSDDVLAGGNPWATAAVLRLSRGAWALHTSVSVGTNAESPDPAREGEFWGCSIMPMRWIIPQRLKFVGRYQFQGAAAEEGIRLNSRYARSAAAQGEAYLGPGSGRGDTHHGAYLGFNYYLAGNYLKIVSGIEYEYLSRAHECIFRGWTGSSCLRFYF